MNALGAMAMPENFRYREVLVRGMPRHAPEESFSVRHPKMDVGRRAKIFAPFDALTGFGDAVASKDILYEERSEPGPEETRELDRRLHILAELIPDAAAARKNRVRITVTRFVPCGDREHDAWGRKGRYLQITGICRGVDVLTQRMLLLDTDRIPLEDIRAIESDDGIFRRSGWEDQVDGEERECAQDFS